MEINSYILKITKQAELPDALDTKKSVLIRGEVSIYEKTYRDKDDGTYDILYKAGFTSPIEVTQGDKVIRGVDKTKKSRKLRGAVWHLGNEENTPDQEAFYDIVMDKLIINLPEIWEMVKNK